MEISLDPFEEEFDLRTAFVERGDSGHRQSEIVGKKNQQLLAFDIVETDAS